VQTLGYPDRETLLSEAAEAVYLRKEARDCWRTEIDAKGTVSGFEAEWRRRDGAVIWVEENAHAVRHSSGSVLHREGSAQDVTARLRAQAQLAEEKARFEQLFAASPEAVVLCSNHGAVLRANDAFCTLFGYSPEEALGRDIDQLVAPERDALQSEARGITQQFADGQPSCVETQRRRKDGRLVHVSILGKPILIGGDQIAIYGIYRDITAQKEAEAALALSRRKVEQLDDAADALAAAKNEQEIYRATCEAPEHVLGFSLGVLCITDGGEFACQPVSSRIEIESIGRTRVDRAGIAVRALKAGRPIIVNDPKPEPSRTASPQPRDPSSAGRSATSGSFTPRLPSPGRSARRTAACSQSCPVTPPSGYPDGASGSGSSNRLDATHSRGGNRRYSNEFITQEVLRASRHNHPIGLLMVDVNRFKEVNDHYGHPTGDMVLREIAAVSKGTVRNTDMVVRYGGDEFLVVLTETGQDAGEAARRVRAAVSGSAKLREIGGVLLDRFRRKHLLASRRRHPDSRSPRDSRRVDVRRQAFPLAPDPNLPRRRADARAEVPPYAAISMYRSNTHFVVSGSPKLRAPSRQRGPQSGRLWGLSSTQAERARHRSPMCSSPTQRVTAYLPPGIRLISTGGSASTSVPTTSQLS